MASAADTLERVVPEWSARATTEATSRTDAVRLHDTEPMEFILSSNWALRTDGVKDFYEALYKHDENFEIQYDHIIQGFRIKCFSHNEVRIVGLVKDALDMLVQKETEKGLEKSAKVISLEDWRKNKRPGEETEVSEKYSFPRDVAMCNIRDTWKIPEIWVKKGITTSLMLPESALSQVQQLTGAVLVPSSDGHTIYVGACRAENVTVAKQKLDILVRFFSLIPRDMTQIVEIFLYSEGDRSVKGEYRYVADGNDKLLRGYVLDRFDWPHPSQRYPVIFQKGVLVRLNPNNEPWEEAQTLSDRLLPIAKEDGAREEFGAFKLNSWRYPAKSAVFRSPDTSTNRSGQNHTTQHILLPEIESWVSSLPASDHKEPSSSRQTAIPVSQASTRATHGEHNKGEPEQRPHASTYCKSNQSSAMSGDKYSKVTDLSGHQNQQPSAATNLSKSSAAQQRASQDSPQSPLLVISGAPINDESTELLIDLKGTPDDNSTSVAAPRQPQPNKPCPFELLWSQCRRSPRETTLGAEGDKNGRSDLRLPLSTETGEIQLPKNDEKGSRSFHMTMNQKAGSRTTQNNIFPEFDPNMMTSINNSLAILMAPLRMWTGIVDLRIELGRFYFLNVKKSRIQEPGEDDDEKHYMLSRIRTELNKRHTAKEKFHFTRVLTSLGADANHIARMSDNLGNPLWKRPVDGRSSIFEFICRRTLEDAELNFIVEIDTTKFSHRVKQFKPDHNCFMVHCTKRVWDFRLVLSVSQDLDDTCQRFAEDLVSSLRVMPNDDRLPELEVSYNKSYNVEVLAVRTRNKACCISEVSTSNTCSTQTGPHRDVQQLHIDEIWEMGLLSIGEIEQRIQLKFARYKDNERPDIPLVWYEAFLKSDTFSTAFEQNEKLEFGSEVKWESEGLLKSGAVEGLVRKAATMIKNMDGVGYWNDNHQEELLRRIAPVEKSTKGRALAKFW
ncbi:hypothetical protein F5Y12DRAFT_709344 [Xylaria sp. FL1777]|nr:hypothetical protein F5Y12DRAFT_709344 [Xylaria sp. FL1777]